MIMRSIVIGALVATLCGPAFAQPTTTKPSLVDMLAANCAAPRTIIGSAAGPVCSNVALTNPGSLATLTLLAGKTLTVNNTATLTATDGATLAIGAGGTLGSNAYTSTAYLPISSLGTGVAAALGTNTGTAGSVVVLNAGYGTPTFLALDHATGLPYSALPSLSANQLLGALTSTSPSGLSVPSCSTAASALLWTAGTGFSCNSSITAAAVPASGLTGSTLAAGVTGSSLTSLGTISSLTATTINGFALGGAISGAGNQINNVIVGASSPLAGSFTTLSANSTIGISNTAATTALNVLDVAKDWPASLGTNIMAALTSYADHGRLVLRRANGAAASPTAVLSGDLLGALQFRGYYVTGGPSFNGSGCGGLNVVADENFTSSNNGTSVTLASTANGAACAGGVTALTLKATNASTSASTGSGVFSGGLGVTGAIWAGTYVATTPTTVGGLPSCAAGTKSARMFVTDSNAASFAAGIGAVVAAGGSTNVPVTCDGTNWRIGANDNQPADIGRKYA